MEPACFSENSLSAILWMCILAGIFIGWVVAGIHYSYRRKDDARRLSEQYYDAPTVRFGAKRYAASVAAEAAKDAGEGK